MRQYSRRKNGLSSEKIVSNFKPQGRMTSTHQNLGQIIDYMHTKRTLNKQDISLRVKAFNSQLQAAL